MPTRQVYARWYVLDERPDEKKLSELIGEVHAKALDEGFDVVSHQNTVHIQKGEDLYPQPRPEWPWFVLVESEVR